MQRSETQLESKTGQATAENTEARPVLVTFVSGQPASKGHIYRVHNRIETLIESPFSATCLSVEETDANTIVEMSDIIIVFRAEWSEWLEQLYLTACKLQRIVIFDIDDFIFDPAYMTPNYIALLDRLGAKGKQSWVCRARRFQMSLTRADIVWTSTHSLAEQARRFHGAVQVLSNGLSADRLQRAEYFVDRYSQSRKIRRAVGEVRIGYASGSDTHHRDFGSVVPVLVQLLSTYDKLRLMLLGHVQASDYPSLEPFRERVEHTPAVAFEHLPEQLARVDINIAPLELNNPFCDAKSELKYFESGIVGVPTVASATSVFRASIVNGKTGYYASSHREWTHLLTKLIDDPALRARQGEAARRHAARCWGPIAQRKTLVDALLAISRENR